MDEPILSLFLSFTPPLCFVRKPILARANNKSIISLALSNRLPLYSSMLCDRLTSSAICSQQLIIKTSFQTQLGSPSFFFIGTNHLPLLPLKPLPQSF